MTERVPAAEVKAERFSSWPHISVHGILWVKCRADRRTENPLAIAQGSQTLQQCRRDRDEPI